MGSQFCSLYKIFRGKEQNGKMEIINKVTDKAYIQWIEDFVGRVLKLAKLSYKEAVIEDVEHFKRIYLTIDGKEYIIRTWGFHPVERDENGNTCAEMVEYTLYEMVPDKDGSHGKEVDNNMIRITWKN